MGLAGGKDRSGLLLMGTAVAGVAAVAGALVSQHRFGMEPCPWCVLQRVIYLALAVACGIGLVWRARPGRLLAGGLALILALCGMAAALWQHFKASASQSCNLTLADKIVSNTLHLDQWLPDVFEPRASCADAAVSLLGVPYDLWSLALYALMAVAMFSVLNTATRP